MASNVCYNKRAFLMFYSSCFLKQRTPQKNLKIPDVVQEEPME
jgi:hypothetical protein